jgi:hypothetical protein
MADNTTSRARALFEQYTAPNGADVLKGLPNTTPKTFEDEQLDFKFGEPRPEDIDVFFSRSLGAFANNAGGVIVFGIRADRDNVKKLDYAHSLSLVPDCDALKHRFTDKFTLRNEKLDQRVKNAVRAKDANDLQAIFFNSPRLSRVHIEPFSPDRHKSARRNGRVTFPAPLSFPLSDGSKVKRYVREKQKAA